MENESFPKPWQDLVDAKDREIEAMAELLGKVGEKADTHYVRAEEQAKLAAHHRERAATDQLTGLLTRHGFKDAFKELLKPAAREAGDQRSVHVEFTVVLLDLDDFKNVNDTYGHTEGDKVLKAAADYLRSQIRASDKIERYGGEEFLILLSRAESGDILNKLSGRTFPVTINDKNGKPVTLEISFSGGMVSFKPSWENLKEAVTAADRALYLAKKEGKNKILIAREEA